MAVGVFKSHEFTVTFVLLTSWPNETVGRALAAHIEL